MKLDDFKLFAKTITRKEFLNTLINTIYFSDRYGTCPNDIRLQDTENEKCNYTNDDDNNCKECWRDATHYIEFKGDK